MPPITMTVDVAIAGAGPGGLAAACALKRVLPSLTIKVYESAPAFRPQGAGVLLNINGFRALKAIDPQLRDEMVSSAFKMKGMQRFDEAGKPMGPPFFFSADQLLEKYNDRPLLLPWYKIRDILHAYLSESPVQYKSKVTGFELVDNKEAPVKLTVNRGEEGEEIVHARMLIGADGGFSLVRQLCLQDGPPTFMGSVWWRARVRLTPQLEEELLGPGTSGGKDTLSSRFWTNPEKMFIDRSAIVYTTDGQGEYVWTCRTPVSRLEEEGLGRYDPTKTARENLGGQGGDLVEVGALAKHRCLTVFKDYPDAFRKIVELTPRDVVTEHGYYLRTEDSLPSQWGRGMVTLLGDAAHMLAVNGQGLNQALEDAAVLGWQVKDKGLTEEALRAYEAQRTPRVKRFLALGVREADTDLAADIEFQPLVD